MPFAVLPLDRNSRRRFKDSSRNRCGRGKLDNYEHRNAPNLIEDKDCIPWQAPREAVRNNYALTVWRVAALLRSVAPMERSFCLAQRIGQSDVPRHLVVLHARGCSN
jgi:hypothetical protein